ncbi:hypothetical protein RJ641_032851 [Dillenia turbinata]|uniref:Transmembrane protein n=1 Tax=Dillenia turbinata TaxID=194707 RepID=A0AAN8ZF80_9MAGN
MAAVSLSLSLHPPQTKIASICNRKFVLSAPNSRNSLSLIQSNFLSLKTPPQKGNKIWRNNATASEILLLEATPAENAQEIASSSDDGTATIISALLFVAFIGLSILTIGVIYISVTDFLQKREREKFEKEEEVEKKKGRKKKKGVRARAGPRGFGQKIDEDDDLLD